MTASSDARVREHRVDIPEGRIRVRILGDGPTVLCLHGASAHGRSWLTVAQHAAGRATLLLPDLLGRGASTPRPDLRYSLEDEVRRVAELVEALRRDGLLDAGAAFPPVVAGHSQGAAIALATAVREPSVRGLLLSNPVTPWTARPAVLVLLRSGLMRRLAAGIFPPLRRPLARAVLRRAGGAGYRAPDDLIEAYAAPYEVRARAETLMRLLADWRPVELTGRLPTRALAVRVVAGDLDPRIDVRSAGRLAVELGGTLRRFPEGGHVLPEQYPEQLAAELGRVLDTVGGDTGGMPGRAT